MERIMRHRGETITLATSRAFATVRGCPPGFNVVEVDVPSSTIEVILVALQPRIRRVYFYDASAPDKARWKEVTDVCTDRNTASLADVSAMQTADRLYVGATGRYAGLSADMVGTNGAGTAALVGEYPSGKTWTSLSITDGTFSTRTLAQDGLITWTVPTGNWQADLLANVHDEPLDPPKSGVPQERLFWTRFRVDAAITDTSVTIAEITALFNATLDALTPDNEGQADFRVLSHNGGKNPQRFYLNRDKHGGIELVSTSITSAANLNWLEVR